MHIVMRTSASKEIGLGHLVRCRDLARHLIKRSHSVHFFIEEPDLGLAPFLDDLSYSVVSTTLEDTIRALESRKPDLLIVDDYRLDQSWEEKVRPHVPKLAVIDDLLRPHSCDILIDVKWRGPETHHAYDDLVDPETVCCLGPAYALVPDEIPVLPKPNDRFTVMIGPGFLDSEQILELVQYLSDPIDLTLVKGPFDDPVNLDHDQIRIIEGQTELFSILSQMDLYIGAAGGILYQLRALNIPALTLATAPNQQTDLSDLEAIGHYFHLTGQAPIPLEKLARWIEMAKRHKARLFDLGRTAQIKIDTKGCSRIADVLEGQAPHHTQTCALSRSESVTLSDHHRLEKVDDRHLNRYVSARNHPNNQLRMIDPQDIDLLDHYLWWFQSTRESWLLWEGDQPQLYIWHEIKSTPKGARLIGGWFVVEGETNFQSALVALSWQLDHCDHLYPHLDWLAVIHRDNKFVQLLNKYVGFHEVSPTDPSYDTVKALFPKADMDLFCPVRRPAQNGAKVKAS